MKPFHLKEGIAYKAVFENRFTRLFVKHWNYYSIINLKIHVEYLYERAYDKKLCSVNWLILKDGTYKSVSLAEIKA